MTYAMTTGTSQTGSLAGNSPYLCVGAKSDSRIITTYVLNFEHSHSNRSLISKLCATRQDMVAQVRSEFHELRDVPDARIVFYVPTLEAARGYAPAWCVLGPSGFELLADMAPSVIKVSIIKLPPTEGEVACCGFIFVIVLVLCMGFIVWLRPS